jgi:hypothetical protein
MLVPHLLELLQLVGPSWLPAEHDGVDAVPESLRNIISKPTSTMSVEDLDGSHKVARSGFAALLIGIDPDPDRDPGPFETAWIYFNELFETLYKYGLDSTKIRRQQ